jgi:hypothetical protein
MRDQAACAGANGAHWCTSPDENGNTVQAFQDGSDFHCLACGVLGFRACLDNSNGVQWCVSPVDNGAGQSVDVQPFADGAVQTCLKCGVSDERACFAVGDNGNLNHWCVSPDIHGTQVDAIDKEGTFMCQACGVIGKPACMDSNASMCLSPSEDGTSVQAFDTPQGSMCEGCGVPHAKACLNNANGTHWCASPAPDGAVVQAFQGDDGVYTCDKCGLLGLKGCVDPDKPPPGNLWCYGTSYLVAGRCVV